MDERDLDERESIDDIDQADLRGPSIASRACGLVGCLLVVALLAGLLVGGIYLGGALEPLADRYLWAPHDVVREYFDAFHRDDTARVERFTCAGAGRLDPLAPFDRRLGQPYVEDEFTYPREGGMVAIYYRLEQHGSRAQALLQREEGGWRICEFRRG